MKTNDAQYWNDLATQYQQETRISCNDFHYGPLLAGDSKTCLLPPSLLDLTCLEIGCGAAQNSFYLASKGAKCTALDVSSAQLAHAAEIAKKLKLNVELIEADINCLEKAQLQKYDFIHSTWALPFAENQQSVIAQIAKLMNSGGQFLLTVPHPVFSGEWIELEEDEQGMFLSSYFRPISDTRLSLDDDCIVKAQSVPIGEMTDWLIQAGFSLKRIVEHKALPIHEMTQEQIDQQIPYDSPTWREMYYQLIHVPVVITYSLEWA